MNRWLVVPPAALLVLGTMLLPARASADAHVHGFDSNLIYQDPRGAGSAQGIIETTSKAIQITATPGSAPTMHFLSSARDFRLSMDVQIVQNRGGPLPLQLKIWSPRKAAACVIEFQGAPSNKVVAFIQSQGGTSSTQELGRYAPGFGYRLLVGFDRIGGRLSIAITDLVRSSSQNKSLMLFGGPSDPGYAEVRSSALPIRAGHTYDFGGTLLVLSGSDAYKVVVDWLDKTKKKIGSVNDWRSVSELNGWTMKRFEAVAPAQAAFAQMSLGAGNGTSLMVSDLFLADLGSRQANFLPNADFGNGLKGWQVIGSPTAATSPAVVAASNDSMKTLVTPAEAPDLFLRLPVAVTLTSSANAGITVVRLSNYELVLPAVPGPALHLDDSRARILVPSLLALALLLLLLKAGTSATGRILGLKRLSRRKGFGNSMTSELRIPQWRWGIVAAAGIGSVLIGNVFLFHLGAHSYDIMGEKTFSYTAARYGISSIYFLPAVTTPAKVWSGVPFAQVPFPYGPTMALFFAVIGWLYGTFLVGSDGLKLDSFQLELLIKSMNVAFGILDGILIYAILKRHVPGRLAVVGACLFLLNPAVWFLMSIWGETQTVSLALLLAAIWLFEKEILWIAWSCLILAAFTRPQLLIPSVVVGLAVLMRHPVRRNVYALSWATLLTFVILSPLLVSIGPSLPQDYLLNTYTTQTVTDSAVDQYNYVSNDGYNIWPLVTAIASGQSGHSRLYFPQDSLVVSGFSYATLGNLIFGAIAVVLLVALLAVALRHPPGGFYLPFAAAALMALLVFKTGVSAHHFLIALPLLLVSRKFLPSTIYYLAAAVVTVTSFVGMYGSLGFSLLGVGNLVPALEPARNGVTRFFMALFLNDRFITFAAIGNAVVLLIAIAAAARTLWPMQQRAPLEVARIAQVEEAVLSPR